MTSTLLPTPVAPIETADSRAAPRRPLVLHVTTHVLSTKCQVAGQLAALRRQGFDVRFVSSPGELLDELERDEGVATIPVPIEREIHPVADLRALRRLVRLFRDVRPDLVNAGTPKAGFLGMLAARLAGVPARIYTLRGLRLETTTGPKRWMLWCMEWIAASCARQIWCVGESLRCRYVGLRVTGRHKTVVLARGSSNGVDASRFQFTPARRARIAELRKQLGLEPHWPVVGFVGRLTRDKGLKLLLEAFRLCAAQYADLRLLLVGDFEDGDPLPAGVVRQLQDDPRIILTGPVPDAGDYYGLMDVLAFPSLREGFPNVVLEASAAGVPAVACEATGTTDAVVHGVTGTIVPRGNAGDMSAAICRYLAAPWMRLSHGESARRRAHGDFRPETIWAALGELYTAALRQSGGPLPVPETEPAVTQRAA